MAVTVSKGGFSTREEATALITALDLFAGDGAMEAAGLEDVHWHQTSLQIYILSGSSETKDVAADPPLNAGAGDVIGIPARTLHAAKCLQPARCVVGFESADAARNFRPEDPDDL